MPKNTIIQNLRLIKASFVIVLVSIFAAQYFFVTPPNKDYFNVNLDIVTEVVVLFSILLTWLSIYNYRKIKSTIDTVKQMQSDDIKESYIQTWVPIAGACLICQLVYFHIYGNVVLILVSLITLLILLSLKIKNANTK